MIDKTYTTEAIPTTGSRPASTWLAKLAAGMDWFVPRRLRDGDTDLLHRVRLTVLFGWTLISLAIVYAAIYLSMNSPIGAAALVAGAGIGAVSLCVIRWTGSPFAAGNLLTTAFFGVLTALACRLGAHGTIALPWYAALPVVALSTAGRRSAALWLAVSVSSLAVFYTLKQRGYAFPNDLAPGHIELLGLLATIGLIVLMLGLALLYESAKDRMLHLIQESQQRYRGVVEDTPLLICTYLPDTTLTFVNEAYCRYYGRSRKALVGQSFLEKIPEQDHTSVMEMIVGLTATAAVRVSEHRVRTPDGAEGWQRWTHRAMFDRRGYLVACQAIGEDITKRRQAEEKLRREKEVADEIINSLPGLFYIFDQDRFVRWNEKWESVTGYSARELEKMYGPDFFEGADKIRIADGMRAAFRDGNANTEAEVVTRDGRKVPFYFTGLRSVIDGKPHLVGLGIDITNQKRTEAELARARNEAESATQAKSEFLANMSHEIRTPMTAILGFSEILVEHLTDTEQLEAASTIKQNGEYLIGIINDLLDLSKIEAGKLEVEHIQSSPCQILSEVASLMRVRASAKNLPLGIEYEGPIPQTINTDPTRLRQILINLTGNAVKFSEVGEIRLVARLLDSDCEEPKMQFKVIDSGVGMTEQQIAKLFKPFQQADTSTTRKFGGTGLGLTVSERLARKLGGDITVQSTTGQGSTFAVTIRTGSLAGVKMLENPTEVQLAATPKRQPAASRVKLDCRVLLAEDGPDNQRLLVFLLKKAGAEVAVAENGRIAHDLALAAREEGNPFDVILMDMQMPVMDGYDATAKLREAGYTGPIIAVTAHAMNTERDRCLQAGCDDYVSKPIDRDKLVSAVAACTFRREPLEVSEASTS